MTLITEFRCVHRSSENEQWLAKKIQVADLCLCIFDDNLVTFEFVQQGQILGTRRFCWSGFIDFHEQFKEWFFEINDDEPSVMFASCVDRDLLLRCMLHPDYVISLTVGGDEPEVAFYADRADVLKLFDDTSRAVKKFLPENAGCFSPDQTNCGNELPASLNLEEALTKAQMISTRIH